MTPLPNTMTTVQALVSEALKRGDELIAAAKSTGLLEAAESLDKEQRVDARRFEKLSSFTASSLLIVLLYELHLSPKRKLKGANTGILALVRSQEATVAKALRKSEPGSSDAATDATPQPRREAFPRYVRVNTLKTTVAKAAKRLKSEATSQDMVVTNDRFVPELLHLPPRTNLHGHALVKTGSVFLMDRSSCLPVAALAPPRGAVVIDACAAPGNKTTMLAARVGRDGSEWVVD